MLNISIPYSENILFETELEQRSEIENKILPKDFGEGEIRTLLGKRNKVSIGVPYSENLVSRFLLKGENIPHEIEQMIKDGYDFHFVSLWCSFLPDTNCKFRWARFGVELNPQKIKNRPIVYDIFPDEVSSEIKCKNEGSLTPQLKFNSQVVWYSPKTGQNSKV